MINFKMAATYPVMRHFNLKNERKYDEHRRIFILKISATRKAAKKTMFDLI